MAKNESAKTPDTPPTMDEVADDKDNLAVAAAEPEPAKVADKPKVTLNEAPKASTSKTVVLTVSGKPSIVESHLRDFSAGANVDLGITVEGRKLTVVCTSDDGVEKLMKYVARLGGVIVE